MSRKTFKCAIYLLAIAIGAVLIKQFCHKRTDGFALYKILSSLPFDPEWDSCFSDLEESGALSKILDQPFYYLAKGAQSYVFVSEDGQTVIKFFRIYHLRPPMWLNALCMPPTLQPYKIRKMIEKRSELRKDFSSYKIASETMKEETGLIYLHLNKTSHLNRRLTIYDKIGIAHELDMDKMEFLVQKRATLVYPAIDCLMKNQSLKAAKEAISALVSLLLTRYEKGIFDKDPDLNTNFGFLYPARSNSHNLTERGIYSNNLKSGEFDKEAPQNFCSERVTIAERQGTSENKHFEVKPTQSKLQTSSCLSIYSMELRPIQIDIGRFCREAEKKSPEVIRDEIMRITDNFRQWLDANYPSLAPHLISEIQKIST
jgi:hypothetical protein